MKNGWWYATFMIPLSLEQWVTIIGASASVLVIGVLLRIVCPLIKPGLVKETY